MLVYTDEHHMIRDAAAGFFAEHGPGVLRRMRDAGGRRFDRDVWEEMARLGLPGVLIVEEHGGVALGHVAAGLIQQAIGSNLTATPFLPSAILGAGILTLAGSPAQCAEPLPGVAGGRLLMALAVEESSRHQPQHIETRATPTATGYRIAGRKTFVIGGADADRLVVAARVSHDVDDAEGIALFLIDAEAEGVTVERRPTIDSLAVATVILDDVDVGREAVVGDPAGAWTVLERVLDYGRVALSAELLGIADRCFALSIDYLKQREQFGVRIGSFQALQHRAARLYCELELARSSLLVAAQALDADAPDAPLLASQAKAKVGEVGTLAVAETLQFHGGIGMTDELDVGLYLKRARVLREALGDPAYHADRMARILGY